MPQLRGFEMDIEAIIINLLTNAVEAMRTTPLPDRHIFVSTVYDSAQKAFVISFADSGKGIRDEDINRIWSPLYTTKVDEDEQPIGTGLGLTIVRSIVNDYRGSIDVQGHGRLGGAEFTVSIPHLYASGGE
jgi:signal transduction histidine kinase